MIKEWIQVYDPKTEEEAIAAIREIMQEVALAGLHRSGFFETAAFYGGTALRIFHGLNRYSEDLDFSLLAPDEGFSLEPYFKGITAEFNALGIKIVIKNKKKIAKSDIKSAFLKPETVWKELILEDIAELAGIERTPNIKIKIEVDKAPPLNFQTEERLLLRPFSFYVKCFTLPDLFAGKIHALLFRKWKSRVKGRDWYDFEWYIKKGIALNITHFLARAKDSGHWNKMAMTPEEVKQLLYDRISVVSFEQIREDIVRFIPDASVLEIWSPQYFRDLVGQMKII